MSNSLRPGYSASLGRSLDADLKDSAGFVPACPSFILDIYRTVRGTSSEISDQTLMDFIPGYRLIHLSELEEHYRIANSLMSSQLIYFPFLANYSNDYICWRDGLIVSIYHDDLDEYVLHQTESKFYDTICSFYQENVYFLDGGFLDYDFEKQAIIGQKNNPGVKYWF